MIILTGAYIGPCEYILNRCIWGGDIPVVRSVFHFSVSFLVISGLLSFVRETVFLRVTPKCEVDIISVGGGVFHDHASNRWERRRSRW